MVVNPVHPVGVAVFGQGKVAFPIDIGIAVVDVLRDDHQLVFVDHLFEPLVVLGKDSVHSATSPDLDFSDWPWRRGLIDDCRRGAE